MFTTIPDQGTLTRSSSPRPGRAGGFERVDRGICGNPGAAVTEHHTLAEFAVRVSKIAVCLLSALRGHDIGTQAPREVWLAIPCRAAVPKLACPRLHIVRMADRAPAGGVRRIWIDGVTVPVFCAARTVVNALRSRNKVGLDVATEALRDGWS